MAGTATRGRYFDGQTGARLDVEVRLEANAGMLTLLHPDLATGKQLWRLDQLRKLQDDARRDQVTLALRADSADDSPLIDLPRLTLTDPDLIARIERFSPALATRDVARGTGMRVVTRLGLAVGAVALMLLVILPGLAGSLAQIIPPDREARWGRAVVAQIERLLGGSELGHLACTGPEGRAALDQMLARLSSGTDLAYDLNVTVFDHEMVNAFAAPGGQIVLMRGLIDAASSADEVAGVLAHEIAHVEARDATRNTLRAAGSAGLLSLVLGDFAGGTLAVVLAEATLSASYTREAEEAADAYALDMLANAQVSGAGLADFFALIGEMQGGLKVPEYLSTHPDTAGRANRAEDFAKGQGDTSPVISEAAWQALRAICT